MPVRAFIALEAPREIREAMVEVQNRLKASDADVRWEPVEKLHATVKFLGNVDERILPSVIETIRVAATRVGAFRVAYGGLGCFPSARRPRVIWVGCEDADGALARLKGYLDAALLPHGFRIEEREFRPHVTLGRVRSLRNVEALTSVTQRVTFQHGPSMAREIALMKSTLRPQGSEYSVIQSFPLQ